MAVWTDYLTNTNDVLHLTIERMLGDYEALHPKMRKCYGARDVDTHQIIAKPLNYYFVL